jgi:hypothetical protein
MDATFRSGTVDDAKACGALYYGPLPSGTIIQRIFPLLKSHSAHS